VKYLHYELYNKASVANEEEAEPFQRKFEEQYKKYLEEYNLLKEQLPKRFLKEFAKKNFHDNIITSFDVSMKRPRTKSEYTAVMKMTDYGNRNIQHILMFYNVRKIQSTLEFDSISGACDWLYCEILPIDNKMMSLEVLLFHDSTLYLEFRHLKYKKLLIKDS
jgi:hypothetical protein